MAIELGDFVTGSAATLKMSKHGATKLAHCNLLGVIVYGSMIAD
jgi:hypothetical protein